jgi:hypothetical protein
MNGRRLERLCRAWLEEREASLREAFVVAQAEVLLSEPVHLGHLGTVAVGRREVSDGR